MDVRRFSQPVFKGIKVDGIIGTVLLYHFISTIDYINGRLVLRKRTEKNIRKTQQDNAESIVIPFWMAGDHYIVAWGTINESEPMLFFVDTGLAGGGFTCPASTLKKAGIELDDTVFEGLGGGGAVRSTPFMIEKLTLGDAVESNVRGIYIHGGGNLEKLLGFSIGGIISHSFFRNYALTFDFDNMQLYLKNKI